MAKIYSPTGVVIGYTDDDAKREVLQPRFELRWCATDGVVSEHRTLSGAERARDKMLGDGKMVWVSWVY